MAIGEIYIKLDSIEKDNSIFRIAIIVSLVAILGKFVGFAREAIIAAYYGANAGTDAFFFAQSMPAMLFPAVCSSVSTAFISIYVHKKIQLGHETGEGFAAKAFSATLILSFILSLFAVFFTPYIVPFFAPGFDNETLILAIKLTRLITGTFVLTMATYMFSAVLNANKYFYTVQVAGLLCNLTIILITLIMGSKQSVEILTVTVVLGHVIQVMTLLYWCRKKKYLSKLSNPFDKDVKAIFILALPILLGNSVVQIQAIVDKALASNLEHGSIAILSYAASLNSLVTSVIVMSLSTVLYPILAENASSNRMTIFHKNVNNSLIMMLLVLLPISIITFLFASDIVKIVFERGKFDRFAANRTSLILSFYAVMYVFIGIREVLTKAFYAIQDTKTPMINGAVAVFTHVLCSVLLVPKIGIIGIPIGATVSSIVASILLLYSVKNKIDGISFLELKSSSLKITVSGIVTASILFIIFKNYIFFAPLFRFILATILGLILYWSCLLLLRCNEAIKISRLIKNHISK